MTESLIMKSMLGHADGLCLCEPWRLLRCFHFPVWICACMNYLLTSNHSLPLVLPPFMWHILKGKHKKWLSEKCYVTNYGDHVACHCDLMSITPGPIFRNCFVLEHEQHSYLPSLEQPWKQSLVTWETSLWLHILTPVSVPGVAFHSLANPESPCFS